MPVKLQIAILKDIGHIKNVYMLITAREGRGLHPPNHVLGH